MSFGQGSFFGEASKVIEGIADVPRELDVREAERMALREQKEVNEFERFKRGAAVAKAMDSTVKDMLDFNAMRRDPNSGIQQMIPIRANNAILDKAYNDMGLLKGQSGPFLQRDGSVGVKVVLPITDDTIDQIQAQMEQLGVQMTRKDLQDQKGGSVTLFGGNPRAAQSPIVQVTGPPPSIKLAEKKEVQLNEKEERQFDTMIMNNERVIKRLTKLIDDPELHRGTGVQSMLDFIPTSKARDVKSDVVELTGSFFKDSLQEMRAMNKTGAAVGNVSNLEVDKLESTYGNLDTGQSDEKFLEKLKEARQDYIDITNKYLDIINREHVSVEDYEQNEMNMSDDLEAEYKKQRGL